MRRRRTHVSSSPLIDPAVSSFLLIAPDQQSFASISPDAQLSIRRNLLALTTAANIMDVPVFVSSPESAAQPIADQLSPSAAHRHFAAGTHALPWLNPDFVAALAEEDRTILLLAGFWLEYQVLATALHGMAEAYDVYVLLDATPARAQRSEQSSHHRLMLAGATPVVTSQVIHEWLLEAPDASRRAPLDALLMALLKAEGQPIVA